MIGIFTALDLYGQRLREASLDSWPEVWAGHWAGERLCGELSGQIPGEPSQAVFLTMLPFGFAAELTDAVCIFEAHKAPEPYGNFLDAERVLYATRLAEDGNGYRTTHWIIPYSIAEGGARKFEMPEMSAFFVPKLNEAYGAILDRRQAGAVYSYEESVSAIFRGEK